MENHYIDYSQGWSSYAEGLQQFRQFSEQEVVRLINMKEVVRHI